MNAKLHQSAEIWSSCRRILKTHIKTVTSGAARNAYHQQMYSRAVKRRETRNRTTFFFKGQDSKLQQ